MQLVYIAHSCSPYHGSEARIGWRIPLEAAKDNRVIVMTVPESKNYIEQYMEENGNLLNIEFNYIDVPLIVKKLCKGPFFSLRLMIWNNEVITYLREIQKEQKIDIVHQINPVEFRSIGDYGTVGDVAYICGPVGGQK